ncbi:unnamed protein product [Rangifer tarandus platyrhynchus]|uniref:Uncharacterized protein n=2 Tax=Rangifer tarandus platyrhynchus TaxID=3082113 RepID=A0ACB0DSW2_RANTA|nr:unnamed protein product [Rangifer tarandus platyrhynchus]CAI9691251.1 unnamed protein product [Rangifer tarandus platyrhynchus]
MTHHLLRNIISIIEAFLSNAKSDGDYQRLNKTELKKLLQEEFGSALEAKVSSPTETERCIESLIAVFQKHAGRDGNNSKLSKAEFLIFMNTELGAFTKNQKDPGVLDRMMKRLDLNSDGQLDFQEFLNLIGGLAIACHESFIKSASGPK